MKISKTGSGKTTTSIGKKKKASGKGGTFADSLKEASEVVGAVAAVDPSPITSVDSVLSVQESSDATEERSRGLARVYGENILDHLDEIRHGLLSGAVSKENLAVMARNMRSKRRQSSDPRLNEIINEVELRAEVEIAKLTRDA